MPNPGGGNQFGNYTLQPPYGDVKRQTELLREAPISGAPLPGRALNAPRRAQKQATRQAKPAPPPEPPQAQPTAPMVGQPPINLREIASIPGASPLVQSLFANA